MISDGGYDWREDKRAATEVNGTHATVRAISI